MNADLYRTFSPTDVAFFDWRAGACMTRASCYELAPGFLTQHMPWFVASINCRDEGKQEQQ